MKFTETPLAGAWVIDPTPQRDDRGYFQRAWCAREFSENKVPFTPLQANMGFSHRKGTLRGLHYQVAPALEAKLVRCTRGAIFDVAVDLRNGSPTFGEWFGTELTATNGRMLLIPEGCAHGCLSLEDNTEIYYMASAYFSPGDARGLRYDDPALAIAWPAPVTTISEQDRNWPPLARPALGGQA
jgi:dTDP-4-dehydrorhamnose 3,5-epimerase